MMDMAEIEKGLRAYRLAGLLEETVEDILLLEALDVASDDPARLMALARLMNGDGRVCPALPYAEGEPSCPA